MYIYRFTFSTIFFDAIYDTYTLQYNFMNVITTVGTRSISNEISKRFA